MKNFARENSSEKKTWGVLGKIQTYEIPNNALGKDIVPLNNNAFAAWDASKSNYRLRPHMPNNQGGVVPQETPTPDVSPSPTPTNTGTPTPTPTNTETPTPTPTPSSTPPALPIPALWYDSSEPTSITLFNSGGINYVREWQSIGTVNKPLTGSTSSTTNNAIYTGSTQFPSAPNVVRFQPSTAPSRDWLTAQFNPNEVTLSGYSIFQVIAVPTGFTFAQAPLYISMLMGDTTTGGYTPFPINNLPTRFLYINKTANSSMILSDFYTYDVDTRIINNNTITLTNLNNNQINNKAIIRFTAPSESGQNSSFSINNYSADSASYSLGPASSSTINQFTIGADILSDGSRSLLNCNMEIAEIMVFDKVLTPTEITGIETYLKTKWGYTSW
jgi:hypothetical protein